MGDLLNWENLKGILVIVILLMIFSGRAAHIVSGLIKKVVKRFG